MGTELSKQQVRAGDSNRRTAAGGGASTSNASTQLVVAEWHDWLKGAEILLLQGRFSAYQEALRTETPRLPSEPMAAALLKAVAKANAAIGKHAEISLLLSADRNDRGVGRGVAQGGAGAGGDAGASEAGGDASPITSLEDALRETIQVGVRATSSSCAFSPPSPPLSAGPPATATAAPAVGPEAQARLGLAVLAAAAEDVAVQVACVVMSSRLARGEATKALSVGIRLLASRRNTVAAAAASNGAAAIPDSSATGLWKAGGGSSGRRNQGPRAAEAGEGREESDPLAREEEEGAAARDVFWGVDALREAFGSALRRPGPGGRRLPLSEAAPRLLHLLRLSWLLAVANLALGRAAAAARIVFVAEHAYGARPSAWRKASHLIATRPPGASATYTTPLPPPITPHSPDLGGAGRSGRGAGRSEGGATLGRDPALAMCRFLRALASLAQGDLEAAAGRLEESLDLEPSGRHSTVCLAHISCFASATGNSETTEATSTRRTPRQQDWKPSSDRTNELLRVLALSTSVHFDSVEQELLLRGSGPGTDRGGKPAAKESGGIGNSINRNGTSSSGSGWGAFREEYGGGVEAWILLACAARAGGDAGGAVSMFRRALALDPDCLEAVYGIARVLQESGDHTASRELLLFLGERSQEILRKFSSSSSGSAPARNNPTNNDNGPALHHQRRLCFPLRTGDGAPGIGGGLSGALVLPAAPAEVMWRVARASMAAKDWPTAILALRGLAASYATGGEKTSSSTSVASSSPTAAAAAAPPPLYYFASFAGGGGAPHGAPSPAPLSLDCPGPGRARALRALAFCQIQRGLYRDALETVRVGLGEGGAAAGGGTAEADDAAMLMLRADALLCLEEGETIVEASLDRAAQLLNRRQIDMSLSSPPPPPPPSSRRAKRNKPTVAPQQQQQHQQQQQQQWLREASAAAPPAGTPAGGGDGSSDDVDDGVGVEGDGVAPHARAVDLDRRLARSAAFNNRAVLLVASGRGEEACRLLRACLLLLPDQARPSFNLTLALWRLGRRRAACLHWLKARGWLEVDGDRGRGGGRRASRERFTRLLESARRQKKAVLQSKGATHLKSNIGGGRGASSSSLAGGAATSAAAGASHVTEGQGDPLSLPRIQSCLLDIRCLSWWLDDLNNSDDEEGGVGGGLRGRTRAPAARVDKQPARSVR